MSDDVSLSLDVWLLRQAEELADVALNMPRRLRADRDRIADMAIACHNRAMEARALRKCVLAMDAPKINDMVAVYARVQGELDAIVRKHARHE